MRYPSLWLNLRPCSRSIRGTRKWPLASARRIARAGKKYQTKEGLKGIGFGTLLTIFEARVGASTPALSNLKKRYWEILANFTHTGFQAVARRSNDTQTGGVNYSAQEVLTMLRLSGVLAHLAAIELAGFSGNAALISTSLDRFRKYGV
jgi:hypothetical protein